MVAVLFIIIFYSIVTAGSLCVIGTGLMGLVSYGDDDSSDSDDNTPAVQRTEAPKPAALIGWYRVHSVKGRAIFVVLFC